MRIVTEFEKPEPGAPMGLLNEAITKARNAFAPVLEDIVKNGGTAAIQVTAEKISVVHDPVDAPDDKKSEAPEPADESTE